ncbi:MAG: DUF2330 domain-containing protein [Chloroflexi bacterium]|nr:DUF2330 domain-containing protein [Chloroflexota bacterium]MDA1226796.1 DUF2330 domain-containing protein [Chloroflexota bacterium]
MNNKFWLSAMLATVFAAFVGITTIEPASACGGFFCQNSPIDQNAERIIFTQNSDGSTSALIQIQYTGSAENFSWILPIKDPIGVDDVEVPEDAMAAFTELEIATDVVFIPPELPDCVVPPPMASFAAPMAASPGGVEVFASGEVGPYGFDVIGSEEPDALMTWLRENNYMVTQEMEPLINIYVEEKFVFLAMKLKPDQGSQDVQPVKITYPGSYPMIPLRLTAVAANPNMAVMLWVYADTQATPVNYAKLEIKNNELVFFGFGGGNNYRQLIAQKADEFGGHGFITEFAAPTQELSVRHPLLQELQAGHAYVTRLNTVISPDEMTVDPMFNFDPQLADVSRVRDLTGMRGVYDCEPSSFLSNIPVLGNIVSNSGGNGSGNAPVSAVRSTNEAAASDQQTSTSDNTLVTGIVVGAATVVVLAGLVYFGVFMGRRSKEQ